MTLVSFGPLLCFYSLIACEWYVSHWGVMVSVDNFIYAPMEPNDSVNFHVLAFIAAVFIAIPLLRSCGDVRVPIHIQLDPKNSRE